MRRWIKVYSNSITCSIVFSVISSLSILSIVFLDKSESLDIVLRIVFPIVFWLGFVGEQFFIWKATFLRKSIEKSDDFRKNKAGIGLISFLRTEAGLIADVALALSSITLLILIIFSIGENVVQYVFIFLLVLSFRLHCILNGKNFRYKKYLAKRKVYKNE